MIKWYKPSEKMPDTYNDIVVFKEGVVVRCVCIDDFSLGYWVQGVEFLSALDRWPTKTSLDTFDYWAYASEFNFPKSEGGE